MTRRQPLVLVLVVAVVLIAAVAAIHQNAGTARPATLTNSDRLIDQCKTLAASELVSPATANFSGFAMGDGSGSLYPVSVIGTITSENEYGALLTSGVLCLVNTSGLMTASVS